MKLIIKTNKYLKVAVEHAYSNWQILFTGITFGIENN